MSIWKKIVDFFFVPLDDPKPTAVAAAPTLVEQLDKIIEEEKEELKKNPPKPKRAKKPNGKFQSDDPATPDVNEAWEGGVAPKPKKPRAKKVKNEKL